MEAYVNGDDIPLALEKAGAEHADPNDYNTSRRSSTADQHKLFKHQPINTDNKAIRLLRIGLIPSEDNAPSCSMSTFELPSAPPYIAVSYTWGPKDAQPLYITLNGEQHPVRENLYNLICFLYAKPTKMKEAFAYLWIDQVCIDQSNAEERNHCVRLMPQVYKTAIEVLQWLGKEPNMVNAAREHRYDALLGNPYFGRLWVVQEVLLAKQAYMLCDDVVLRYDNFAHKVWPDPAMEMTNAELTPFVRYHPSFKHSGCTLEFCIAKYSSKACENPRDKVYGLLGLVRAEEQVPVDYRKSVLMVFLDTVKVLARVHLEQHRQLQWEGKEARGRPRFVTTARFLARNMGLVRDDVDIFDIVPSADNRETLWNFLAQIGHGALDTRWFYIVLQALDCSVHYGGPENVDIMEYFWKAGAVGEAVDEEDIRQAWLHSARRVMIDRPGSSQAGPAHDPGDRHPAHTLPATFVNAKSPLNLRRKIGALLKAARLHFADGLKLGTQVQDISHPAHVKPPEAYKKKKVLSHLRSHADSTKTAQE